MCENCKGCVYWRALAFHSPKACHYFLDTGVLRGGSPEDCTKKDTSKREYRGGDEWRRMYGGMKPLATA